MRPKKTEFNIVANYASQAIAVLLNIITLPLYVRYFSPSEYGLIGIFALLQFWLGLLDAGMSQTLSREIAYCRDDSKLYRNFSRLLRSVEIILLFIASVIIILIVSWSDKISRYWFGEQDLSHSVIGSCLELMVFQICLRLFVAIYKSGLIGLQDQVVLSSLSIVVNLFRYIGGLLFLMFVSTDITDFFTYQLLIAFGEVVVFVFRLYQNVGGRLKLERIFIFDLVELKRVMPFALSIFYSTLLWILMTQVDKLIFSKILSLREFGYLSIVALVASSILQGSSPITLAYAPRLTRAFAEGRIDLLKLEYSKCTRMVTIVTSTVAAGLFFYSHYIILIWTDNVELSAWADDILIYYVLGNVLLVLSGMQYLLQFSFGDLKLHVKGANFSFFVQVPIIIFVALNYGIQACAITFMIIRLIWFLFWPWFIHQKLIPNFHFGWFFNDVLLQLIFVFAGFYTVNLFLPQNLDQTFLYHFSSGVLSLAAVIGIFYVYSKFNWTVVK